MFNIITDSFSCLLQFSYAEAILGTDLQGLKHATNCIGIALCAHQSHADFVTRCSLRPDDVTLGHARATTDHIHLAQ